VKLKWWMGLFAAILLSSMGTLYADVTTEAVEAAQRSINAGDPEQAISLLAPWIKKNPKDANALLVRSTARFVLGRFDAGIQDLEKALQLDPTLRQAWLNRAAVDLANHDYERALVAFGNAERLAPDEPDNALNIGAVHLLKGDLAAATTRFRSYLKKNPRSASAYYLVASNYGMVGQVALATQALDYAIQLDEKVRRRARVDPNFSDVARDPRFRELLETDRYRIPSGALRVDRKFNAGFTGPDGRLLDAVIRSLELTSEPFDQQVEVAEEWALVWAESFRIKVSREDLAVSRVELTAAPGSHRPEVWKRKSEELFRQITVQLFGMTDKTPATPKEPG